MKLINSPDQTPDWDAWNNDVRKIVLGPSPGKSDTKSVKVDALPADLAERFPGLTHLYLWQIKDLKVLPPLPPKLECLDVRGCGELTELPILPTGLETLVIEGAPRLATLALPDANSLPSLNDLSVKRCTILREASIHALLAAGPNLRHFDASGCRKLISIPSWPGGADSLPPKLVRIDLNDCVSLETLPPAWPKNLRRVGLRGANSIRSLPDFPRSNGQPEQGLDYLDLAYATALKSLPGNIEKLRTLFIHGSGLDLPPELFGGNDTENVAARVLAFLEEAERGTVADHEVKVILLGNGRCGKSSLVRRLLEDRFDPNEPSTHGIRLRTMNLDFRPVDEAQPSVARLNIWDFAGQDLYHNTHRTFLQSKAVYLLCRTNHGDGADAVGDTKVDPLLEAGDDVRRSLRYWREQIASLGSAPGMDGPPPILLVRMKADRDGEAGVVSHTWDGCEAGDDLARFDVSAQRGDGIEKLKAALATAVARVLGPKERRSLGKRPMKVKDALRPRKAENEAAFLEGERSGRRVPSPHPILPRGEFDALVRQHCPGSDYARDPGLLLQHLHLSGFLYYDASYLPDSVILDQPWAFEAVYTVMHRGSCHPRLKQTGGKFSPANLAEWAWSPDQWNPTGYSPEEQELFLKFMESHRVAAKVLEAAERDDGQARYVAPYYLPQWENVAETVQGLETPHGPITAEAHFASVHLGRDVAQGLLIDLVRRFSRSAELWKWGAHFKAFSLDAAVTLHWNAADAFEAFGGQITASYRGRDSAKLHAYVVERLRSLPSFPREVEIDFQPQSMVPDQPLPSPQPPAPDRGRSELPGGGIEATTRAETLGVRVALSYAGSDPNALTEAERNLGALPKALARYLHEKTIRVMEYSDTDRQSNLAGFTEELIKQDYLVIFLSAKYYRSPYCMWELMLLFQEPPPNVFPPGRTFFLAMPGMALAGEGELMKFRASWDEHWETWCQKSRMEAAEVAKGDGEKYQKCLKRMIAAPWYEFACEEDLRLELIDAVFADCFKLAISDPAAFQPGTPAFSALTDNYGQDVVHALGKPVTVYQMAARLWQRAGREVGATRREMQARAKQLYHRARRLEDGFDESKDRERMANVEHQSNQPDVEDMLNELRRACLGDAQDRTKSLGL